VGKIEGSFTERYADYIALFDETLLETDFSIDKFFAALFSDIEIREQERLMDRIKTVHQMLFPQEKKDYSFMCFELLWLVFSEQYGLKKEFPIIFENGRFKMYRDQFPRFSEYIYNEWRNIRIGYGHSPDAEVAYVFPSPVDIPQLLIWYLWQMYPNSSVHYQLYSGQPRSATFQKYLEEFKQIDALLQLIK